MSGEQPRPPEQLDPNNLQNYDLLIPHAEIQERISEIAEQISKDSEGKEVVAVGILDGAVFFAVDLLRKLQIENLRIELIGVATYQGTRSTERPVITKSFRRSIEGKHVLLVEDILDSGVTLDFVQRKLAGNKPASLKTAVLLAKNSEVRKVDVPVDYVGFADVQGWVVGYGFDVDGHFRNLSDIYVKKDTR